MHRLQRSERGWFSSSPASSETSAVLTFPSADKWQAHFNSAKDARKLMVLDFTASWGGLCKLMKLVVNAMASRFSDVQFVRIYVDELPDVAKEFKVQSMPTFVFIKRGVEVDRIVGAEKEELEKKILLHRAEFLC